MEEANGEWEGGAAGETLTAADSLSEAALTKSQPFVGRWNRLVSTTNWEKGRIICQWREALAREGAAPSEYADEAWAQLVGGVSGQHVGRLRRVYQRFDAIQEKFPGLFWSHFQAALDWNDAEMWLEGAVQSGWSVAAMRQQRWETLGRIESERPRDADVVTEEADGDVQLPREISGTIAEVQGPQHEGPDFGDDETSASPSRLSSDSNAGAEHVFSPPPMELVQPFAALPELPDDLAEAFESFKLALLRHKADNWQQVPRQDVLQAIESLKSLVLAPASDGPPF